MCTSCLYMHACVSLDRHTCKKDMMALLSSLLHSTCTSLSGPSPATLAEGAWLKRRARATLARSAGPSSGPAKAPQGLVLLLLGLPPMTVRRRLLKEAAAVPAGWVVCDGQRVAGELCCEKGIEMQKWLCTMDTLQALALMLPR
jgi:hypothetical protein